MRSSFILGAALFAARPAFATSSRSAGTVASMPAVASQLGDASANVLWDSHGRVHRVYGQLGVIAAGATGVEAFLRDRAAPLGLRADEQLAVTSDQVDAHGLRHVRVQRRLFGLEVKFDSIRLHAGANGMVYALESELSGLSSLRYQPPALLPIQAETIARHGFPGALTQPSRPTLVVLGDVLPSTSGTHLAFQVRIAYERTNGQLPVVEDVYVDAQSGALLRSLSQVFTDGTAATMSSTDLLGSSVIVNVTTYMGQGTALKDTSTLMNGGQILTLDGSNQNNLYTTADTNTPFTDPEAVSVAENVTGAIAFFNTTFGWTHWDFNTSPSGIGGTLAGIAHVGTQLDNAYFTTASSNGQTIGTMNFGDGDGTEFTPLAKATDVTGHEMGHGIVAGSAQLVYENQSGALNEHLADTFGWEFNNANNTGTPVDTIGATVVGSALAPALRNLCDPHQGQQMGSPIWQPADMSEFQALPDDDNDDHGGVHTNSGIPNHAACLFRNAVTSAGGNGFQAVEKVWFQTLTMHLASTSTFADMVTDSATSCSELSLDSATCASLNMAWASVGLATNVTGTTCPTNATSQNGTCVCGTGYAPSADGSSCVAVEEPSCTTNSHDDNGQCYCDSGYVPDPAGTGACVASNTVATCPANASEQGGTCVCNECFQPTPTSPGDETDFTCTAVAGCVACPDPVQGGSTGACTCETGTTLAAGACTGLPMAESWDETACCPVAGNCGSEDFAGRCVGNTLVFCDDTQSPEYISIIDCMQNTSTTVCGLDTQEGGYDCVAPVSDCGTVPETGVCSGSTAQICEGGVLESVDCGSAGCGAVTYSGDTYQYCLTAPATSGSSSGSTGGSPGTSGSGGASGSAGSTGSDSGGGSSGGCSTGGGASSLLALLALGLIPSRRRR